LPISGKNRCLDLESHVAENAMQPLVSWRKDWLFSASYKGVQTSANLYS
jgi:hypothetical protein